MMKQKILIAASLLCFASLVWSACDYPGSSPTCSSVGHPNVPDGTYPSQNGVVAWKRCNQNYVCGNPNPGYSFVKRVNVYQDANGNRCADTNNIINVYPEPPGYCCIAAAT